VWAGALIAYKYIILILCRTVHEPVVGKSRSISHRY
jgi:hypothetical protein